MHVALPGHVRPPVSPLLLRCCLDAAVVKEGAVRLMVNTPWLAMPAAEHLPALTRASI